MKTNRQLHEEAAGMNLDDNFFLVNGIDPDAVPESEKVVEYHNVQNEYGFPQMVDEENRPVCASCHSCVLPNRDQGTICDTLRP